jgi:hypothetical protein
MAGEKFYVSQRHPELQGGVWFVNGPGIPTENPPEFETADEGRAYLVALGIEPDQILIEKF